MTEKDLINETVETIENTDVELVQEIRELRANSVPREQYEAEIRKLNDEKRKLARMAIEGDGVKIEHNENEEQSSVEELAIKLSKADANTMSNLEFIETMMELHEHGYKFSENKMQDARVKEELSLMLALAEGDPRRLNNILQEIEEPLWHKNKQDGY